MGLMEVLLKECIQDKSVLIQHDEKLQGMASTGNLIGEGDNDLVCIRKWHV